MARIPEEEIERLKQEVSVQRLVEARGVKLKRHGADLLGLCPFHNDTKESLVISPKSNLWHCLGACQSGGSVIDWVMRSEGVSFRHAVELLREGASLRGSTWAGRSLRKSRTNKLETFVKPDTQDTELLTQVIDFYHQTLKQSPEALSYLESRGLTDSKMLERFKLGFANRALGYRLPPKANREGAEIRDRLQKLGLYRSSGHEHFSGSLVIPVFDEAGQVVEVYGRKINQNLRKGTPLHLYLPGPHKGVWNLDAVQVSEEIILCESLIDALTFWCAGFRNVTSSYGIEGFTTDLKKAFRESNLKRVLIAYDRDQAGDRAAAELAKELLAAGLDCYRVMFPSGMDANEYACKVQPAEKSLELVIRKAVWLGKGKEPERTPLPKTSEETEPIPAPAAKEKNDSPGPRAPDLSPDPLPVAYGEKPAEALADPPDKNQTEKPIEPPFESLEVSPARMIPPPPIKAELQGDEVAIQIGNRRWRVRGLSKNLSYEQMKVNVLVSKLEDPSVNPTESSAFHVDTLDMYSARHRSAYVKLASEELGLKEEAIKKDLGKVLLKLEELQDEQIKKTLEPKQREVALTEQDRKNALKLLKDPSLLERILEDFERCGVVGEETNKLTGYLAAISRKLEEPLAVVIQSSSAAGKTSLMEAVLSFVPEEERVQYSAMTGQSLFYMGECDLKHKVLAIVEEEGAERASYALKLLQSEGKLTIASTGKDPQTGRLITHEYHVEGPVMIFLTTTAIEIDEELLNRCLVLSVCEEREQTKKIHKLQRERETLEGLLARKDKKEILKTHQDAQRLLRPLLVANPYAPSLTFMDNQTRTRRDHMKYLTLIRTIALLHQYQRPIQTTRHNDQEVQYIEVSKKDIEIANQLAHEVLGRSLDELPPQTRRLLVVLDEFVGRECKRLELERSDYHFTRRMLREGIGWGDTQLKVHLQRLEELEYVVVHRGNHSQRNFYELMYDGQSRQNQPFMAGLIDPGRLQICEYDTNRSGLEVNRSGENGNRSATGRGVVGPWSGGGRGVENHQNSLLEEELEETRRETPKNALREKKIESPSSYVGPDPSPSLSSRCAPVPMVASSKSEGSL